MSDDLLPPSEDGEWLTFREAASRFAIVRESVRKRAVKQNWLRRKNGDGHTELFVPRAVLSAAPVLADPYPGEWLTDLELSERLNISANAARHRQQRGKWPRRGDRRGVIKSLVPATLLKKADATAVIPEVPPPETEQTAPMTETRQTDNEWDEDRCNALIAAVQQLGEQVLAQKDEIAVLSEQMTAAVAAQARSQNDLARLQDELAREKADHARTKNELADSRSMRATLGRVEETANVLLLKVTQRDHDATRERGENQLPRPTHRMPMAG